jgi:hypothetical protein
MVNEVLHLLQARKEQQEDRRPQSVKNQGGRLFLKPRCNQLRDLISWHRWAIRDDRDNHLPEQVLSSRHLPYPVQDTGCRKGVAGRGRWRSTITICLWPRLQRAIRATARRSLSFPWPTPTLRTVDQPNPRAWPHLSSRRSRPLRKGWPGVRSERNRSSWDRHWLHGPLDLALHRLGLE